MPSRGPMLLTQDTDLADKDGQLRMLQLQLEQATGSTSKPTKPAPRGSIGEHPVLPRPPSILVTAPPSACTAALPTPTPTTTSAIPPTPTEPSWYKRVFSRDSGGAAPPAPTLATATSMAAPALSAAAAAAAATAGPPATSHPVAAVQAPASLARHASLPASSQQRVSATGTGAAPLHTVERDLAELGSVSSSSGQLTGPR